MTHPTPSTFSELNLHPALTTALEQMQWDKCTPIQSQAIPRTMNGGDIAGKAQTGTGKTGAFLVSLLHYLMTTPVKPDSTGPYAMILAPTRELANQIYDNCLELSAYTGLEPVAVYGGKEYDEQKSAFIHRNPDIVIGTPGRIIDLFKQKLFRLDQIEALVLDEADRMFDLGFISDIRYLIKAMPDAKKRMNLIFSATYSYRVQELAYEYLNGPELIEIESETETADKVEQVLYHCSKDEKPEVLATMLQNMNCEKSVVFVNMKVTLERLLEKLKKRGINAVGLSGDIPQHKREKMLKQFQDGDKNVLLATDVAARGLHIDDISHVFNYDLPQQPEDYIHRIGRTGRAGKSGHAISLACEDYVYPHLEEIEEKIGEKIPTGSLDDVLGKQGDLPKTDEASKSADETDTVMAKTETAKTEEKGKAEEASAQGIDVEATPSEKQEVEAREQDVTLEPVTESEASTETVTEVDVATDSEIDSTDSTDTSSDAVEEKLEQVEIDYDNAIEATPETNVVAEKTERKTNYPPRVGKTAQNKSRNRGLYRRRTPTRREKPSNSEE